MHATGQGSSALIGRERELALLHERLTAARGGHGTLVLIAGEAGIGKTALAETMCWEAEERGARVLVGRCYDLTETPPYGPWIELFSRYQQAAGETGGAPSLPAPFRNQQAVGEAASQVELFHQTGDFLTALAASHPVVLFFDDLHWADGASLDLLRVAARGVASLPILVVITYRADELTDQSPLARLLPIFVREAHTVRLNVSPLSEEETRAFVDRRFSLTERDRNRLAVYLRERGEGTPFFMSELLHMLEETGVLYDDGGAWTLGDLRDAKVPPLVRQVIRDRLGRLSDEAQSLLMIGALIGQEISLALWATVTRTDEDTLVAVIERAHEAHLVHEMVEAARFRFVHALTREALMEALPISQRRRWHRQIAEVLAANPTPDPDAVAYHFRQAGDSRAVEWLIAAGKRAQAAYALLDAGDRYEAALALQEGSGTDPVERGWLLLRLAHARRWTTPRLGIAHLDEALRIAEATGNKSLAVETIATRGLLHIFCSDFRRGLADLAAGVEWVDALSGAERAEWTRRTGGRVTAPLGMHTVLVLNLAFAGRFSETIDRGEPLAAQMATTPAQPDTNHASVWFGLAMAYAALGRVAEAADAFAKARASYRTIAHNYLHALCGFRELRWARLAHHPDRIIEREQLAREVETALGQASGAGYSSVAHLVTTWGFSRTLDAVGQAAWSIRCRNRSNLPRPYIARFTSFSLLICPSVCPLLSARVSPARTAA